MWILFLTCPLSIHTACSLLRTDSKASFAKSTYPWERTQRVALNTPETRGARINIHIHHKKVVQVWHCWELLITLKLGRTFFNFIRDTPRIVSAAALLSVNHRMVIFVSLPGRVESLLHLTCGYPSVHSQPRTIWYLAYASHLKIPSPQLDTLGLKLKFWE